MLYEYKIQKLLNGNDEIRYAIKYRSLGVWWIKKKLQKLFHPWTAINGIYKTIGAAQEKIEIELSKDKANERGRLVKQNKVLEEYNYKMVPNHIPDEQVGKFMETSKSR